MEKHTVFDIPGKLILFIFLIIFIGFSSAVDFSGRFTDSSGYLNDGINFEGPGKFISSSFNYSGEDKIIISGNIEDIRIKFQSSDDGFETIEDERIFDISGNRRGFQISKVFDSMDGEDARIIIDAESSGKIHEIEFRHRASILPFLILGILIFGGGIFYLLAEYI